MSKSQIPNSKSQASKKKKESSQPQLVGPNEKTIFKISWDKIQPHYQKHLSQEAKKLKLSGFRQGKVPVEIAKKHLALDQIKEDTLRHEVAHLFEEYVKKNKIKFLHYPEIKPLKTDEKNDWEVEVHYAIAPKINVKNYQTIVQKTNKQTKNEKVADDKKEQPNVKEVRLKAIFQALANEYHPTISELLIRAQATKEFENIARSLQNMGLTVDDYLQKRDISLDQLGQELTFSALGQLQIEFILQEITKEAKLTIEAKEVKTKQEELIKQGLAEKFVNQPDTIAQLEQNLLREKTLNHLLSLE